MTFWWKGNKLPSFVQFTAGAGSPLTVQLNVTLDPICALWFTGALIIVGFRPSRKGNKDVFYTIDLSRILAPTRGSGGQNTMICMTSSTRASSLFLCLLTGASCGKDLLVMVFIPSIM